MTKSVSQLSPQEVSDFHLIRHTLHPCDVMTHAPHPFASLIPKSVLFREAAAVAEIKRVRALGNPLDIRPAHILTSKAACDVSEQGLQPPRA